MKKLMLAVAIVCAAAMSHAAAFSWATGRSGKIYEAGTTTVLGSATAYLFEVTDLSQSDIVTAFANKSLDLATSGWVSKADVASGAISTTNFTWGNAEDVGYFYAVILSDDKLYVGDVYTGAAQASSTTKLTLDEKSFSQAASKDATAGYSTAGWYTAVPEPTSALMLLLGMAGLALRRKQA